MLEQSLREPRPQRSFLVSRDEDVRHTLLPREVHQRLREVLSLHDAGVDLKALREIEVTLEPVALVLVQVTQVRRFRDVDGNAVRSQVVRHAATAANQGGAGRIRFEDEQQSLAWGRGER